MPDPRWDTVLARLTRHQPDDLDDLLGPLDARRAATPGADAFPAGVGLNPFAPAWRAEGTVAIGVRVRTAPADPAGLAARLAAFALEREAEVVVLSEADYSGLERFGFRTERVAGPTPEAREACERQSADFWGLEVVL